LCTIPNIDCGIDPNPNVLEGRDLPDEYVYASQAMMQVFATEVFRLFAKYGSKIRALALSPAHMHYPEPSIKDGNGHQWPQYSYTRGITRAVTGMEYVVAVPALLAEFPYFGSDGHWDWSPREH
jgi:hypothetical protein